MQESYDFSGNKIFTESDLKKIITTTVENANRNNLKYNHWKIIGSTESIFKKFSFLNKQLTGIMIGVKDIISTQEFPTRMGVENAWEGTYGSFDARCIAKLRELGATIIGKNVSSEFAVHKPTEVINPRAPLQSAGTSSAGSAVAVAVGDVPISIATQTAGSIARPASYCGVIGFKPSFGDIPRTGILKTTEEFDTVGFFANSISLTRIIYNYIKVQGQNYPIHENRRKMQIPIEQLMFLISDEYDEVPDDLRHNYKEQILDLFPNLEVKIENFSIPIDLVRKSHEIIYKKEISYFLLNEINHEEISDELKTFASEGSNVSDTKYTEAKNLVYDWRKSYNKIAQGTLIASIATSDTFIRNSDREKKDSNLLITASGGPQLVLPILKNNSGIVTGLSISSSLGSDLNLLQVAKQIEEDF